MGKSNVGGKVKAPDAAARMNYLYQAAHVVLNENSSTKDKTKRKGNQVVATYYTQLMVGIGHKSVQRSSKELKRTICKGCRGLLIPGVSASVTVDGKNKRIGSVCGQCKTKKLFPLNDQKKKKS